MMRLLLIAGPLFASAPILAQNPAAKPSAPVRFSKQIAPILASACIACHSARSPQNGLSTASYAALMKGGKRGRAVIPGNADGSLLVQYIEGRKQPQMPIGGTLKPAEIALIKRWIKQGAKSDVAGDVAVDPPPAPKIALRANVLPQAAALAWSQDGRWLAVGTYQEVKLFDGANGKLVRTLKGHADVVRGLAFSPDGSILAAAGGVPGEGGEVKLWNVETGAAMQTYQGHADCIYGFAWRPASQQFATTSYDKTVKLWTRDKTAPAADLKEHADAVFAAVYTANGKLLATASADRSIKVWDAATGKRLYTLAGHTEMVTSLAAHPTADQIASGSADKTVRVWNLNADNGQQAKSFSGPADVVTDVRFSADARLLAAATNDGKVFLWEWAADRHLRTIEDIGDAALALAFHPNGETLAVGGYDGSVKLYKVADGALVTTFIEAPKRAAQRK